MEPLERFIAAQAKQYESALSEIKKGKKITHWMWYIFPQVKGLGFSETARYYALQDLNEAREFLDHPILGKRLLEITAELLKHKNKSANEIFGYPDDLKLHSSMTVFSLISQSNPIFKNAISAFFKDFPDEKTIEICK
ncbi:MULTISPECIES: DUF1810 domain-containing protein [Pedobacter]|uniref:DUF1810 domain-containing protein n=1 Tax=Pedobacter TaxID=84567 RepID=UPI001E3F1767|nr:MULTISPECIES: DUF1810 domain-containing protein [Pedobacter]